jgi:uncharacterized membrane protein YqaE (UPF0057 family)
MPQQDVAASPVGILTVIAAILLPPLGVFLTRGLTPAFWVSVVLTILAFVPGVLFALLVILAPRLTPIR